MPDFPPTNRFAIFFAEGPCSANRLLQRELLLVSTSKWPHMLSTIWPFQLESLSTTSSKPTKLVGFRYSTKNIWTWFHLMKIRCEKSLEKPDSVCLTTYNPSTAGSYAQVCLLPFIASNSSNSWASVDCDSVSSFKSSKKKHRDSGQTLLWSAPCWRSEIHWPATPKLGDSGVENMAGCCGKPWHHWLLPSWRTWASVNGHVEEMLPTKKHYLPLEVFFFLLLLLFFFFFLLLLLLLLLLCWPHLSIRLLQLMLQLSLEISEVLPIPCATKQWV